MLPTPCDTPGLGRVSQTISPIVTKGFAHLAHPTRPWPTPPFVTPMTLCLPLVVPFRIKIRSPGNYWRITSNHGTYRWAHAAAILSNCWPRVSGFFAIRLTELCWHSCRYCADHRPTTGLCQKTIPSTILWCRYYINMFLGVNRYQIAQNWGIQLFIEIHENNQYFSEIVPPNIQNSCWKYIATHFFEHNNMP